MDAVQTMPELLAAVETEHGRLRDAIAQLSDEQLEQPRFDGGWSVKDILAHVTFWERRMLYALGSIAESGIDVTVVPPEIADIPYSETWTDEVNARIFSQSGNRSLADVRADFQRSYADVLARFNTLSPEDVFAPGESPSSRTALGLIVDNTSEHYREHADAILQEFG